MSEATQKPDTTPGIFSWNELMSNDAAASAKFYSELFGWGSETMSMGPGMEYTFFKAGERTVGGLLRIPPGAGGMPTNWMGYVTVIELEAAVARAQSLGANICRGITSLPMGRFAVIADPQGAVLGLWEFGKQPCE